MRRAENESPESCCWSDSEKERISCATEAEGRIVDRAVNGGLIN
jgi:hypothetical protein